MLCGLEQDFASELKYFYCVRQSQVCGTAQHLFYGTPVYQRMQIKKTTEIGATSQFGENCWYEFREDFQMAIPSDKQGDGSTGLGI